ncbi:hypothetical protein LguiB_030637 [Lonicera macranthoides]
MGFLLLHWLQPSACTYTKYLTAKHGISFSPRASTVDTNTPPSTPPILIHLNLLCLGCDRTWQLAVGSWLTHWVAALTHLAVALPQLAAR